ncbi:hypothetical protein [Sorangium sp. So ce394]|uniref:hypothetical protein n=1 Tax=Sorangium sp. So ce394 TaxID=3133310 RepID=UPI003F5B5FB8
MIDPTIASYLQREAQRRPVADPEGEANRDSTGFVRALLEVMGGAELPVLAGYRLGSCSISGFEETPDPCVAAAAGGVRLRPTNHGVDATHAAKTVRFAPSLGSALERLVRRDRAARAAYRFRVHAAVGAELAALLGCDASAEWHGYHEGALAIVDEVLRHTDIDCLCTEAVTRLLDAAEQRQLPLTLREDVAAPPCDEPPGTAPRALALDPRDAFARQRPRDAWDGEALLRLELRGDAVVEARLAFGEVVDVRVASRGEVGWSTSVDRQLGSPRVQAYLARRRVSRVKRLAQPAELEAELDARGLADWRAVAAGVEAALGGVVGAGPWGGVEGLFVAPRVLLEASRLRRGDLPAALALEHPVQRLADTEIEGFLCGWLDRYNPLFVDRRGHMYSVHQETGDERPWACAPALLLEKLAVYDELAMRCESPVVVDADIAVALSDQLGATRVAEASDEVSEFFVVSGLDDPARPLLAVERCAYPRIERAPTRALLWAGTPDALLLAARAARALAPEAVLGAAGSYSPLNVLWRARLDPVGDLPIEE